MRLQYLLYGEQTSTKGDGEVVVMGGMKGMGSDGARHDGDVTQSGGGQTPKCHLERAQPETLYSTSTDHNPKLSNEIQT